VKWVILGLVLTNVAFFGWRLSQDQKVVVADAAAPPPTGAAMVNRLLLVNEVESGVLRRRRALPSQQLASPPQPQPPEPLADTHEETASVSLDEVLALPQEADRECYTIGPLENEDDISALAAWFSAQGSQATLRSDERREVTSTWVFLPPLESREAPAETWRMPSHSASIARTRPCKDGYHSWKAEVSRRLCCRAIVPRRLPGSTSRRVLRSR